MPLESVNYLQRTQTCLRCLKVNLRPKDYTQQEQHIQHLLDECGLRYDTQYSFINYIVDFWIAEIGLVIEADGVYGHLKKRDVKRDMELLEIPAITNVLHIKETNKEEIKKVLWQALDNL